jgi:hypothetical protein
MSEGKQLEDFVIDTPKKNPPRAPPIEEQRDRSTVSDGEPIETSCGALKNHVFPE